jgi:hypothetical protein
MKNDVRGVCLALVKSGTGAGRCPRPAALGWKLQSGEVAAAELDALCASVHGALMNPGAVPRRWAASAALRALMAEYEYVRGGVRCGRQSKRAARDRRAIRPADCA